MTNSGDSFLNLQTLTSYQSSPVGANVQSQVSGEKKKTQELPDQPETPIPGPLDEMNRLDGEELLSLETTKAQPASLSPFQAGLAP